MESHTFAENEHPFYNGEIGGIRPAFQIWGKGLLLYFFFSIDLN